MTTRQPWRALHDEVLRDLYPDFPTCVVAVVMDRSERAIYQRARDLRIRKSPEYLAGPYAGRIGRGEGRGVGTRFQPGQAPFNKGRKGWIAGGRSAEHRFKPGRLAHEARNYRPIGSLRISKDGYLERKVTDDPKLVPARRWVGVHRLAWEAQNGPVPDGYVVTFKPGRRTTDEAAITADAVELTSRIALMQRNTRHNWPPALNQLVQLRGALNRKINNRSRAREEQDGRRA
jgi:hypothetical protein